MESIKILPHHAISYFEVFYLERNPEEPMGWYDNEKMRQNGVDATKKVTNNPNQLVQIVSIYDEWCRMCPHNSQGSNYEGDDEGVCNKHTRPDSERKFAKILGLEGVLNGGLISAETFFELMKHTYDKLMSEPEFDSDNKRKPLHQIFRVPVTMRIFNLTNKHYNKDYDLVKDWNAESGN